MSETPSLPSSRPLPEILLDLVVVGGGVAGLACARRVRAERPDAEILVLDKGRAPGGRLATRRSRDAVDLAADHGAQYFTAREPGFRRVVEEALDDGAVARWQAPILRFDGNGVLAESEHERFVGTPRMASFVEYLATGLDARFGARVVSIRRRDGELVLRIERAAGGETATERVRARRVAVTAPSAQALDLVDDIAPGLARALDAAEAAPCWAVIAQPREPLRPRDEDTPRNTFGGAFVDRDGQPLAWIADNATKPGRPPNAGWTLHASPEWSRDHLGDDPDQVARALWDAFLALAGDRFLEPPEADGVAYLRAHCWRYARVVDPSDGGSNLGPLDGVGVAGDGCLGPRVELAWQSGDDLGRRFLREIRREVEGEA